MQDGKYLHNYPRFFSPFVDFYKKMHYNPKIYKLSKLFNKSKINYLNPEEKPKDPAKKKPKVEKKQEFPLEDNQQSKIPHLPKLPIREEIKIIHSYEFHSLKFSNKVNHLNRSKKIEGFTALSSRKGSESISKGSVQNFNFNPLIDARNASNPTIQLKSEETIQKMKEESLEKLSEKIKRKIIYSKRKHSDNVKDFSSFFDYQDGQFPLHSSFSN
jgi:hypothetical protein